MGYLGYLDFRSLHREMTWVHLFGLGENCSCHQDVCRSPCLLERSRFECCHWSYRFAKSCARSVQRRPFGARISPRQESDSRADISGDLRDLLQRQSSKPDPTKTDRRPTDTSMAAATFLETRAGGSAVGPFARQTAQKLGKSARQRFPRRENQDFFPVKTV